MSKPACNLCLQTPILTWPGLDWAQAEWLLTESWSRRFNRRCQCKRGPANVPIVCRFSCCVKLCRWNEGECTKLQMHKHLSHTIPDTYELERRMIHVVRWSNMCGSKNISLYIGVVHDHAHFTRNDLYQWLYSETIGATNSIQFVLVLGVADNSGKKSKVTSLGEGRALRRFLVVGVSSTSFESASCWEFSDCLGASVPKNWKVFRGCGFGLELPVNFCTSSRNSSGWILYTRGEYVWMTRAGYVCTTRGGFAHPPLGRCKPVVDLWSVDDLLLSFTCTSIAPIPSK